MWYKCETWIEMDGNALKLDESWMEAFANWIKNILFERI